MKNVLVIIFFFCSSLSISAQENEERGTIRIEKKGQLKKIIFDNVNYRLIGIDRYGNIIDSAVVEFEMSVIIKGISYSEQTVGPQLTYKMQQLLGKCDDTSIIYFEKIKAKDKNGTVLAMPKFKYVYAYSNQNND